MAVGLGVCALSVRQMPKREPQKCKETATSRKILVWHVSHWAERYGVDSCDWPKNRGLLFVRQFVAPADTESTTYFGQLRDLRGLAQDDRIYHYWKSLWEDLRAMTATQGRNHQGYFLDEHQQPLKEVQIAARLLVSLEETRRALQALSAVNLMERVPLPTFEEFKRMEAAQEAENGRDKTLCGAQDRAKKRSCGKTAASAANAPVENSAENGPEGPENGDSGPTPTCAATVAGPPNDGVPFNTKGNGKDKDNSLTANGNLNENEKTANGSAQGQAEPGNLQTQAEVGKAQSQGQRQAEPYPPATQPQEPLKPKGAEQGQGREETVRHTGSDRPPRSLCPHVGTLGDAGTQVIRRLSGDAQSFAEWVYAKLGLSDGAPVNSEQWRRQVAAIGGIWVYAETQLTGGWLDGFRTWAYERAEYLRDHRNEFDNHVAKWMSDAGYRVRNDRKKARRAM